MAVFLTSRPLAESHSDGWISPDGTHGPADLPSLDVGQALEQAFAAVTGDYLNLCRRLGSQSTAILSHTASAAVNASDLALMMAWTRLAESWVQDSRRVLLLVRDPWLFRHFAALAGVQLLTPAPSRFLPTFGAILRGTLARLSYTARTLRSALSPTPRVKTGGSWLLSYTNPASDNCTDAYFGPLLAQFPDLRRIIHVDGAGSAGLAQWGGVKDALSALRSRWQPSKTDNAGLWGWLVQRAAIREGATAQGAAIAWQCACQRRFLAAVRPAVVAWPWENHGWERDLCRAARIVGTRSVGYQHATIGRTEFNIHPGSNSDGSVSIPDRILCIGPLLREELVARGVAEERLRIGGALRYSATINVRHNSVAPLFAALPADRTIALQLMAAARQAAHILGRPLLVRPHPIYDVSVAEDDLVRRATVGLAAQPAVSVVIYAATTVGLEAILANLPTIRFVPQGCVALDILPNNIVVPVADARQLTQAIRDAASPPAIARNDVFAPVDLEAWRAAFDMT